jgi:hypothetical protein
LTAWTSSVEVKKYSLVKWDSLNYVINSPFTSEVNFNSFVDDILIPRAQGHINAFCKRDFDTAYPTGIPDAIKDVAARATANMIQYLVMNKMGPLIRTGDYQISIPDQSVLTKELRALLAPWVKRTPHVISTPYKTDDIKKAWDES